MHKSIERCLNFEHYSGFPKRSSQYQCRSLTECRCFVTKGLSKWGKPAKPDLALLKVLLRSFMPASNRIYKPNNNSNAPPREQPQTSYKSTLKALNTWNSCTTPKKQKTKTDKRYVEPDSRQNQCDIFIETQKKHDMITQWQSMYNSHYLVSRIGRCVRIVDSLSFVDQSGNIHGYLSCHRVYAIYIHIA
jgi:hypothetical protein